MSHDTLDVNRLWGHMTHKDELLSEIMSYNKDIAFAWGIIIDKIHALRGDGKNLQEIGGMLGVGHGTVSRWLRGERGGERTSFADMVKYCRALNINPIALFPDVQEKTVTLSAFDKVVANNLAESIRLSDNTDQKIAAKTGIMLNRIGAIVNGEEVPTPEELYLICKEAETGASSILNKAAEEITKNLNDTQERQQSA